MTELGDERRSKRANVMLIATLQWDDTAQAVKLLNLSAHGALVVGDGLPAPETPIVFFRNNLIVAGCIAWVQDSQAGVEFSEPLDPQEVLRNIPSARSQPLSEVRRPGFRGRTLTSEERQILEEWGGTVRGRLGE